MITVDDAKGSHYDDIVVMGCPTCDGTGRVGNYPYEDKQCPTCDGKILVKVSVATLKEL